MYILDPTKAFGLTDDQAASFARRLDQAAERWENSWDASTKKYQLTVLEAAEGDEDVDWALQLSWNEALDWAREHGLDTFLIPRK